MSVFGTPDRTGLPGAVERLVTGWAVVGGVILLLLVVVNVFEVLTGMTRPWTGYRFTGGVEITELAAAAAAFCFLPYCQLTDANVTADIFTARATPRWVAFFKFVASAVAICFALLLLWRMSEGMADQRTYRYATTILSIPIWWAFVPIVISLGLLVLAACVNFVEYGRHVLTGEPR